MTVRKHARPRVQRMSIISSFQKCPCRGSVRVSLRTPPRGSGRARSIRVSDSFHILSCAVLRSSFSRGGATVLKVGGGTILRAERAKKIFGPPTFWPVGGQNIA